MISSAERNKFGEGKGMDRLYNLLKDRLDEPQKGVISDHEMCLFNRRDFMFNEASPVQSFLGMYGSLAVSYEMFSIIDYLYAACAKISDNSRVRVFQLSKSMTLPALAIVNQMGEKPKILEVVAPRGCQKINATNKFALDLANNFAQRINKTIGLSEVGLKKGYTDIVLCNASNEAEVASAIRSFERVTRGLLLKAMEGTGLRIAVS